MASNLVPPGTVAATAAASTDPIPDLVVVYVTAPSQNSRCIADELVRERLAACVNILPGVLSVYRWQGEVETAAEELLLIKSRAALVPQLTQRVRALHPYEECEVVAVPITGGSDSYMRWVASSTQ